MRILAVRGKNLASLPEFDVRFDDGADAPGHLVAIVGPTGAGKSTLLDAVCLALYDRAPRLLGAREVAIGENETHGQDPRSIMRRGSAESMAEVDIVARDRETYRATWESWRAYRRTDGRLQAQRLSLVHLPTGRELTGATKTETLANIQDLVGLSFDEFRRAVLLAQGDFSAFLNARADERAELLEKMTGTQVYGELSRSAFERARAEDEALAKLEREVEDLHLLSEDARGQLAGEVDKLRAKRAEVEAHLEAAKIALQWHEMEAALVHEAEEAQAAHVRAQAERSAAQPDADTLERQAEAETLRPVFERAQTTGRAYAETRKIRQECEHAAGEAERNHRADQQAEDQAIRSLADAEARARDSEAELAEAKRLDAMLESATEELERARTDQAHLAELEARTNARVKAKLIAQHTAERRHEELARWLREHPTEARIASSWPRWADELNRLAETQTALEALDGQLAQLETEVESAGEAAAIAEQAAEEAQRQEAQCVRRREEQEAITVRLRSESSGPDLRRALERTAEERAGLDDMERAARSVRRHHRKRNEEVRTEKREQELALAAEERLAKVTAQRTQRAVELDNASRALDGLRTRLDLASRRGELLKVGQPCPLCGAVEHPAARDPGPDDAELAGLTSAVRSLEAELAVVRTEEQAKAAAVDEHRRAATEAARRMAEHARTADEEAEAYRLRRERLSMLWIESPVLARYGVGRIASMVPDLPRRTAPNPEIDAAREALDRLRRDLLDRAETTETATVALEQATTHAETARQKREAAEAQRRQTQTTLETLSRTRGEKRLERRHLAEQRAVIVGRLREAFQGWDDLARLETEPAALAQDAAQRVNHFVTLERAAKLLTEAVAQAAREGDVARVQRDARRESRERAEARVEERTALHAEMSTRRGRLFEGRTAAEVEEGLQTGIRAGREALEAARHHRERTAERWAETRARLESTWQREQTLDEECRRARAQLAEGLRTSPLADLAQLEEALETSPENRQRLAEKVAALTERETQTRTTLADRQRRLESHRADHPPAMSHEDAHRALTAHRQELFDLTDRLATAQVQHAQDEQARRKARSLVAQLSTQYERTRAWAELSALIGSADGRKFRTFAQSFTLEILLEQANLHLRELRPRYHLQRVADRDMDLFVEDRDLGDEPRPISTLSGGERFLVSLALALGLSSLSSRSVRLDSLFIDEGFGALDRDSLETALAVLDQLQAEGRTIGLISHVADLAERVVDRVEVQPVGPGTSEVRLVTGA